MEMKSRIDHARAAYRNRDVSATRKAHTAKAIHDSFELHRHSGTYVGDFIYGAIDGSVTTFAVVSGVAGAGLSPAIVIILGFANLFGDGFSMAASNYVSTKSVKEFVQNERKREEWEVKHYPEGEVQEIRHIFSRKGFKGRDLDRAVNIVTSNKKVWVDTMMADELGLLEEPASPLKKGLITFIAFLIIGFIPLMSYVFSALFGILQERAYMISITLTFITFFLIGSTKIYVTGKNWLVSGLETLLVGGFASGLAYLVGYALRGIA